MRSPSVLLGFALACALGAGGCIHHIGDACTQNVDCSALGDRFCDTAAPGGYCTVEGCDVRADNSGNLVDSCPSEAVCIRFFTQIASEPCDPTVADLQSPLHCAVDQRCLCDCGTDPNDPSQCLPSEAAVDGGEATCPTTGTGTGPRSAHCAPVTSERRWCQLTCGSPGDCRAGYTCRATGTHGAEPVPRFVSDGGVPFGNPAKFCVPGTTM
jgi:hypothetical protein